MYAVVVSYNATPASLARQFQQLAPQVNTIVWVDNGSSAPFTANQLSPLSGCLHHIQLPRNLGIGAAQNVGIHCAIQGGATHILFMDDDSLPAPDMVSLLFQALDYHPEAAAVGAFHADPRRGVERTPFSLVQGGHLRWQTCSAVDQVWEVDYLIASGCLIPVCVLQAVGFLREDFFIDWVDVEWCFRARNIGYRLYGVCAARLEHTLGDQVIRVLGREIPLHSPLRHYYQSRNFVLMIRSTPTAFPIMLNMAWRQFKRFVVFSTLVPGRLSYFRMWMRGLWHGLLGRSESLPM